MALCVTPHPSTGAFVIASPQPASLVGCPYVIQSGTELTSNPFLMTRTEALDIGTQMGIIWVTVAVIKTVSRRF